MKLNVRAFALSCGILWGIGLFVGTWWMIAFGGSTDEPTLIGRIYLGYRLNALGSFIGLVWAFIDGLIGGALFAWLYNLLESKFKVCPFKTAQDGSGEPTDQATRVENEESTRL